MRTVWQCTAVVLPRTTVCWGGMQAALSCSRTRRNRSLIIAILGCSALTPARSRPPAAPTRRAPRWRSGLFPSAKKFLNSFYRVLSVFDNLNSASCVLPHHQKGRRDQADIQRRLVSLASLFSSTVVSSVQSGSAEVTSRRTGEPGSSVAALMPARVCHPALPCRTLHCFYVVALRGVNGWN